MVSSSFAVEQARLAEARQLPGPCHDDFLRLSRTLIHGPPFQWLLVEAPDEGVRRQVMDALDRVMKRAGFRSDRLPLSAKIADVPMLEERLVKNARQAQVVHVIGSPGWFDEARWEAFNARRERLAANARARLVFWLDGEAITLASRSAPDLWAWRGGVYSFLSAAALGAHAGPAVARSWPTPSPQEHAGVDTRSMAERSRRVAEIRAWLESRPEAPDELRIAPIDELGRLLFDLGDYDDALAHWRDVALPLHGRLGDARNQAIVMGRIADILLAQGQLDESLRIRQEEQLPVYEELGDVLLKAVTMGKIADILKMRGRLDEALHIYQEEELPIYESLADVRGKAIVLLKIASILQALGQLDEARRLYEDELVPAFEHVGDVRSTAVTMGKVAEIMKAQGQWNEALHIYQEKVLPVFERLGDVRSKASVMWHIAQILQARDQLDEALRIYQEEVLPIFGRLGDVFSKAITLGQIADILQEQGLMREALRIYQEEELPVYERLGAVREKAVAKGRIANIIQALNQEEAGAPPS